MDEFTFIRSIQQPSYRQSSLQKGIGDDAAVFRETQRDIVTAVDTFVEGIHFTKKTIPPKYIGYRALAANLSDIAAMGATPTFYLASAVIPTSWHGFIKDIFQGMRQLANRYHMDLIGGDTVSGDRLMITIHVIGTIDRGKAIYRNNAQEGDIVFVTGTLGDSRAGLYLLKEKSSTVRSTYLTRRHQKPSPRVSFAQKLTSLDRITLNDISDGIASEAKEIALASQQNIVLDVDLIPISEDFKQFPVKWQNEWKLFGGEDFELLGAVSRNSWYKVKQFGKETNTKVSKVGYILHTEHTNKYGRVYLQTDQGFKEIEKYGYIHLS